MAVPDRSSGSARAAATMYVIAMYAAAGMATKITGTLHKDGRHMAKWAGRSLVRAATIRTPE